MSKLSTLMDQLAPLTARVRRFDVGESLAKPERTADGFLRVDGRISRVGVQIYEDQGGGQHRELRLPEEVFAPEAIASFKMVPVTNTHPPMLLDARSAKQYAVGALGEDVRKDGEDFVAAPMVIYDAEAIVCAELGRSQLSCGYSCELEEVAGVHPVYGAFDAIQRRIRGNHVALVDVARAGPEARLRLDGGDRAMLAFSTKPPTTETPPMAPVLHIDGLSLEISEANAQTIRQAVERSLTQAKKDGEVLVLAERAKLDAATKELAAAQKKLGLVKINVDRLNARRDAMKAKMVPCDACDGSGKIEGEKCDYCDGAGSFRMHDAIKAAPAGDDPDGDGDEAEAEDAAELDADELATEQETEGEAKAAHKDGKLMERAKSALKRRRAWLDAFADRKAKRRAPLLEAAHKHLGADVKLDGLSNTAIKAKVVEKLKAGIKLDGKTAAQIDALFEVALLDAQAAPTAADLLRGHVAAPAVPAPTAGGVESARERMLKHNADAWKRPAQVAK